MRIGIIGYGNIAERHLHALRAVGGEAVGAVNRSETGAQKARAAGIPETFTRPEDMLEKLQPDALLVSVSFDQLFAVCRQLLPYRLPILLEKPAGTHASELEVLIREAADYGTPVQVAMNRRHYEIIHAAIADAGGWGAITAVDVEWSEAPLRLLDQKGYSSEQVAKIIHGNSIHGIDLATFFGGAIEEPQFATRSFGGRFRWYMQFSGISNQGKLVSFRSSWDHPVPWKLVLSTESKRYVFAPLETCMVQEEGKSDMRIIEVSEQQNGLKAGFHGQWKEFKEVVRTREVPVHNLESCRPSMHIADALYQQLRGA